MKFKVGDLVVMVDSSRPGGGEHLSYKRCLGKVGKVTRVSSKMTHTNVPNMSGFTWRFRPVCMENV